MGGEMTADEILAMWQRGADAGMFGQRVAGDTPEGGMPQYEQDPNTLWMQDAGLQLYRDPETGAVSAAPLYGFQDRNAYDVYTANPDGTVSTRTVEDPSTWDKLKPGLLAMGAAFGGGALYNMLAGGAAAGAGGASGAAAGGAAPAAAGAAAPVAAGAAPAAAGATGGVGASTAAAAVPAVAAGGSALFPGEGMASGVPEWDAAATRAGLSLSGTPELAGGLDWSKLIDAVSSGKLTGPALAAVLGAAAGVSGNADIDSSRSSTSGSTSNMNNWSSGNTTSDTMASSTGTNQQNAQSSQQGASETSLAPWLQGYARDYVARADALSRNTDTPGDLTSAQDLIRQRAASGDPLVNAAQQQQQALVSGSMLNGNPYLDDVARRIGDRMGEAYATGTRAGTFDRFNDDGNSVAAKSAFQQQLANSDRSFGDSLGMTLSNLYSNDYRAERAAQDAAARGAPAMAQYNVDRTQDLFRSGADQRQWPYAQLDWMRQAINPAWGSQTANSQTGQQSVFGTNTQQGTSSMTGTSQQQGGANTNTSGWQNDQTKVSGPSDVLAGMGGAMAGVGLWRSLFGN